MQFEKGSFRFQVVCFLIHISLADVFYGVVAKYTKYVFKKQIKWNWILEKNKQVGDDLSVCVLSLLL